jgi:hypothetical protein
MNALDDIEALADAADEEVPDEAEGLRTLHEVAAGRLRNLDGLGENVEHLALWRGRPMADAPMPCAMIEAQRGLRVGPPLAARPRHDGADGRQPPLRIGA